METPPLNSRGPRYLRKITNVVLDALVKAEEAAHGGTCAHELHLVVDRLKASQDFEDFYHRSYRELMEIVENEKMELRRSNAFGRLVIHALGGLMADGTFSRDMLPNIFSFLHLVLGDDTEAYGERCKNLVAELKEELGDEFTWDSFYDDARAKLILWHTLVRISASFRRWDLRKDWFIKLMAYTPSTVSVGQNAFVVRERADHDEPQIFGEREFCQFFTALFTSLTEISPADEALFRKEFGTDPHHLIGDFLVHLASCVV